MSEPPKREFSFRSAARANQLQEGLARVDVEIDRTNRAVADVHETLALTFTADGRLKREAVPLDDLPEHVTRDALTILKDATNKHLHDLNVARLDAFEGTERARKSAIDTLKAAGDAARERDHAQDAARTARDAREWATRQAAAAANAKEGALTSYAGAQGAAAAAAVSEDMAYRWAEQLDGPVVDPDDLGQSTVGQALYSAKWWAIEAQRRVVANTEVGKLVVNGTPRPGAWFFSPENKPIASKTALGFVKVGDNLTIEADGTLNATGGGGGGGGVASVTGGDGIDVAHQTTNPVVSVDNSVARTNTNAGGIPRTIRSEGGGGIKVQNGDLSADNSGDVVIDVNQTVLRVRRQDQYVRAPFNILPQNGDMIAEDDGLQAIGRSSLRLTSQDNEFSTIDFYAGAAFAPGNRRWALFANDDSVNGGMLNLVAYSNEGRINGEVFAADQNLARMRFNAVPLVGSDFDTATPLAKKDEVVARQNGVATNLSVGGSLTKDGYPVMVGTAPDGKLLFDRIDGVTVEDASTNPYLQIKTQMPLVLDAGSKLTIASDNEIEFHAGQLLGGSPGDTLFKNAVVRFQNHANGGVEETTTIDGPTILLTGNRALHYDLSLNNGSLIVGGGFEQVYSGKANIFARNVWQFDEVPLLADKSDGTSRAFLTTLDPIQGGNVVGAVPLAAEATLARSVASDVVVPQANRAKVVEAGDTRNVNDNKAGYSNQSNVYQYKGQADKWFRGAMVLGSFKSKGNPAQGVLLKTWLDGNLDGSLYVQKGASVTNGPILSATVPRIVSNTDALADPTPHWDTIEALDFRETGITALGFAAARDAGLAFTLPADDGSPETRQLATTMPLAMVATLLRDIKSRLEALENGGAS